MFLFETKFRNVNEDAVIAERLFTCTDNVHRQFGVGAEEFDFSFTDDAVTARIAVHQGHLGQLEEWRILLDGALRTKRAQVVLFAEVILRLATVLAG